MENILIKILYVLILQFIFNVITTISFKFEKDKGGK